MAEPLLKIDQAKLNQEIERAVKEFQQYGKEADTALQKGMTKACLIVEADAKRNLRDGGHVVTGRLLNSITHRVNIENDKIIGRVGSVVFYAPYIEFGTKRAPAYPYIVPAIVKNKIRIADILKQALGGVTR